MILDALTVYDLAIGLVTGVNLIYLLYLERVVVSYRPSLLVVTAGVLVFSVASPTTELLAPIWVHIVHGLAALLVIVGLYKPVHRTLETGESALPILVTNPASMRLPPTWMSPMDDDILEIFQSTDMVLTPAIIAYNLNYSREEVNRHLSELETHGVVERVERGKYRISARGERYLEGRLRESRFTADASGSSVDGHSHS